MQVLKSVAEARLNTEPPELSTAELVAAAHRCGVLIANRQTPAPASLFMGLPDLKAIIRCAKDTRSVAVDAAGVVPKAKPQRRLTCTRVAKGLTPIDIGAYHFHRETKYFDWRKTKAFPATHIQTVGDTP